MFSNLVNQKYRRMCLGALESKYSDEVELLAERKADVYYGIWRIGALRVETIIEDDRCLIYEYRQTNNHKK